MDVLQVDKCRIEQKQDVRGKNLKKRLRGVMNKKSIVLKSVDGNTIVTIDLPRDTLDWCRIRRIYGKVPPLAGVYSADVMIHIDELNRRATVHAKCSTDDDVWFTVLVTLDVDPGSPKSDDSDDDADYDPDKGSEKDESEDSEEEQGSEEEEEEAVSSDESES